MEAILLLVTFLVVPSLLAWLVDCVRKARRYNELKPKLESLTAKESALAEQRAQWDAQVNADRQALDALAREKSRGFPCLAEAYADYYRLRDMQTAAYLERKPHPAPVAAKKVREIAEKRREAERLWRVHRYQLEFYESLFPWLTEFREIDDDDLLLGSGSGIERVSGDTEEIDPATWYLTPGEYERLSRPEKFQRALDRYWQSRKTKWQIGRDYERYVGYLYERDGWDVTYFGIIKGLEDLGRDLLVQKGDQVLVVQCKCWAARKTIHEKHVFQLFGTTLEHWIASGGRTEEVQPLLFEDALRRNPVRPVLYTSTVLSDQARVFARVLGVEVHESVLLERYPCIKCNYTKARGQIYHLPFDQQYDRTKIQDPRTERFVATVAEAEGLGYRRAFRWRGAHRGH